MQGRFTSPDEPLLDQSQRNPASWNLYSFVRNNPLRFIDPSGNQTELICPDCPDGPPLTPEEIENWNRQVDEDDVPILTTDTNLCGSCGPAGMVWDNGDPMKGGEMPGTYRWDLYAGTWVRRTWSD